MTAEEIFPYSTLPKVAVDQCPVCDTVPTGHGWSHDRYGYRVPVVPCPSCHLTYLGEQLTREGYARLYDGAYRALTEWRAAESGYGPLRPPEVIQDIIGRGLGRALVGHLPVGGHLLDAGGSTGALIPALGLQPKSLTVLDPAGAELARVNHGARTIHGWLEDPIPGTYDGVVCLETMDHVTQPVTVLRNLRASCPRGWLLADYCMPSGKAFKIDHPLAWHPDAWAEALHRSHWRQVHAGSYRLGPRNLHQYSICH